jgi:DNA-binding IscR family transcriptional regulator
MVAMTPKNGQFACIPAQAASIPGLGAYDLRVLIAIALHADGEGRAYPSLARIASRTCIARQNVSRSIARLEKAGLVRHWRHKSETGVWANSVYEIIFQDAGTSLDAEQSPPTPATEQVIKQKDGAARATAENMLAVWRSECGDVLPIPWSLDRERLSACQARFRDSFGGDIEQWRSLCREIRQSLFCCGAGERRWLADFDWALKPKSIRNVREGKCRNDRQPPRSRGNGTYDDIPPLGPGGT